jgi:hypothetical protein
MIGFRVLGLGFRVVNLVEPGEENGRGNKRDDAQGGKTVLAVGRHCAKGLGFKD